MESFNRSVHRGFDWGALISGVLLVIVSILLLRHPDKGLRAFVLLFGLLSIVQGFVWLTGYARFRDFFPGSWVTIISGVLDIIIGILFLSSYDIGGLTIAYLFAIWFLVDSIVGIIFSWHMRYFATGHFVFNLIMNIISLILAIFLILHPVFAALSLVYLVAFWLLIFGINEIITSWLHR